MSKRKATVVDPIEDAYQSQQAAGGALGAPAANGGATVESHGPISGAEYDATMGAVSAGIAARKNGAARKPLGPNAVRAMFLVVGLAENGNTVDVIGTHKTKRRAFQWLTDNAALISRVYRATKVYRARELSQE